MMNRRDFLKVTMAGGAFLSMGSFSRAQASIERVLPNEKWCHEDAKEIPILTEVDLVVIGGSSQAIAAATAAAKAGCRVFLVTYLPYMGDDVCGAFRYDVAPDEELHTVLSQKLFDGMRTYRPLFIKTVLENELIANGVDFLYSSFVTDVIEDRHGSPAGVVITNRSGRQAIKCKGIIDATAEGIVARMAGASFRQTNDKEVAFFYTVVGGEPRKDSGAVRMEELSIPALSKGKKYPVIRYLFRFPLKDDSYATLQSIEQQIRTSTWTPEQVDSSDVLGYLPPYVLKSRNRSGTFSSVRSIPLAAFLPTEVDNVWVLGPCADLPEEWRERLMRPALALYIGELVGEQIGAELKKRPFPTDIQVHKGKVEALNEGTIKEILQPLRPLKHKETVHAPEGSLPLWGDYDVIVLGGGTAGASAGISAARQGVKTLVIEYLHGLGGLGTLGLIGCYWDGFREGFTATIDRGVHEMAPADHPRQEKDWKSRTVSDWKMEWYRRELLKAGGTVWFGAMGCGALVEKNRVKGLVVTTPFGRGIVRSKVVIDSTGSGDIAIAAGASFEYTGAKTLAVQGAGLGKKDLGDSYLNNDWLFIDDTDILDVSRAFVQAKAKFKGYYDLVKIPQTRERRRVIGEYYITVYDVLNHRHYPDTISYHQSSFDTHGMIVDPYFVLSPPMPRHAIYNADVPLRSLLPKGLDGILVTGLGASAHRDAMPVIRMQPCLQNQGYAVGYLSARCVKEHQSLRSIDIKKIQKHLVEIGNLPGRVLKDKEFKGFSTSELKQASLDVKEDYKGLERLLTNPEACRKLVSKQLSAATDTQVQALLGSILCILGDAQGAPAVSQAVISSKGWDKGWNYTGMHQFGMSLSRQDALIMALGKAKATSALPVVLAKALLLQPEDYFSHFRAVTNALGEIRSSEAIPTLASMLTAPGVRGYALDSYARAQEEVVPNDIDTTLRNLSLKELHIAKALYLCGDKDGIAREVLQRYANGLQGHYARFAYEVLQSRNA